MATPAEFPFIPDWSAEISVNPRISEISFGDGYTQRLGKGINNQLERISLTFSGRTDEEAIEIMSFFNKKGGVTPFTAQIGIGKDVPIKKYVTSGEYKRNFSQFNFNSISVTFQEVP